ncbi:MAG: DUF952 domain-containing protein, partial [Pseudomonadota bacterium]
YTGSSDDARDGFIHLSTPEQLSETAAKHFAGQSNLIVVGFRADDLGDELRWEQSRGGALFPHLYGSLSVDAAVFEFEAPLTGSGVPDVSEALAEAKRRA